VPRAIDEALRERGVEPVDTPDVRDVSLEEGQALTFTASFDTVPPFEVGDYTTLSLKRPPLYSWLLYASQVTLGPSFVPVRNDLVGATR
jgi:hypothetical protein